MLLSMTGFGSATRENDRLRLSVEVRTVNNRYLKIATKTPDSISVLESRIEKVLKEHVARGTVTVSVRIHSVGTSNNYQINESSLQDYWKQIHAVSESIHIPAHADLAAFLMLPGVIEEKGQNFEDPEDIWPLLKECLQAAVNSLMEFRKSEGKTTAADLQTQLATITNELQKVVQHAPQVANNYRDRILERVKELLSGTDVEIDASHLIREVSVFADRCDINEEITRLRSHLDHFTSFLQQEESLGRKLDFLTQEMNREVNTIGSKANMVDIAHCVVEMKSAVEKIRENLQNVE